MPPTLRQLASTARCAIYNDLSHMNPRYLTPQKYAATFLEEEITHHKRNLLLLSLYFDKIIICTDNIFAFTKFMTKDVVTSVVTSSWFVDLVEHEIIVLAGWGSTISLDFMKNQENYSMLYRPDLKERSYSEFLSGLSARATWVAREEGIGEREHVRFLLPQVRRLEGVFDRRDTAFLIDLVEETQNSVGYMGTMEMFPFIDEVFGADGDQTDAFYRAYYTSWHEYCAATYAPAIPIHTRRITLPHAHIENGDTQAPALAALYSPDIFERYLTTRFGAHLVRRLLAVRVTELIAIRNGDWARFRSKYHEYVEAASRICWIAFHPQAHALLETDAVIDELIAEIFRSTQHDSDLSALGNAIDLVLGIALGATGVAPAFALFKKQINRRLGAALGRVLRPDLEPYLRKLRRVLEGHPTLLLISSAK